MRILFLAVALSIGFSSPSVLGKPARAKLPQREAERPPMDPAAFQRVDPHGLRQKPLNSEALRQQKSCEVCHAGGELHPATSLANESCMNCHNQQPHSGVVEHYNKKDITCASCHSYHRADALPWQAPSGRFASFRLKTLSQGEIDKPSSHPMLKKNCVDCHKW